MFWSRRPTVEERAAVARAAYAADIRLVSGEDANPPWYDHIYLGAERPDGLMVEVVHTLTSLVDEALLLAREFMRIGSQVLNVLHALNGRYCGHPSAFKRLDALEHELPIAPHDLAARLRSVFTLPAPEGAEALRSLFEETYDLVEVHLPEVDVDRLRALFRSDRQPLETLPTTG
ncbi:hypothetical protein EV643_112102 [Kribbella sp. VKM Ac-2527]|uniref:Uncharacterized protein n=1 Tax=Kribbella caucasensis TaxID=2512215 RepID=A0A4V3C9I4_9ACTN|nr:hypothetical protein EV643_112102 [Kribbella sp. VKM Ac-2527]